MSELSTTLAAIKTTLHKIKTKNNTRYFGVPNLPGLAKVLSSIGNRVLALPKPRLDYVAAWKQFRIGRGQEPSLKAMRHLCWEPEIGLDLFFMDLLKSKYGVRSKALQGLVHSCHSIWEDEQIRERSRPVINKMLSDFRGNNKTLNKWKQDQLLTIGANAETHLGKAICESLRPLTLQLQELNLDPSTQFTRAAVTAASDTCRLGYRNDKQLRSFFIDEILKWNGWDHKSFRRQVDILIVDPYLRSEISFRDDLIRFVLSHPELGDPRLPRNQTKWLGLSKAAQQQFVQWLSAEDIIFFFEHVIPRGNDFQGRKEFWLRYVPILKWSRPLLSGPDLRRLTRSDKNVGDGSFGRYAGVGGSAFILHFRNNFNNLLVVEFSEVGAIYVYDQTITGDLVKDFWKIAPFSTDELKQRKLASNWVSHFPDWQERMRNILARYGFRP